MQQITEYSAPAHWDNVITFVLPWGSGATFSSKKTCIGAAAGLVQYFQQGSLHSAAMVPNIYSCKIVAWFLVYTHVK
jgi:hypothetical protein